MSFPVLKTGVVPSNCQTWHPVAKSKQKVVPKTESVMVGECLHNIVNY